MKHTWNTLENAKISGESLDCFRRPPNPIIFFWPLHLQILQALSGQMSSLFDLLVKSTTWIGQMLFCFWLYGQIKNVKWSNPFYFDLLVKSTTWSGQRNKEVKPTPNHPPPPGMIKLLGFNNNKPPMKDQKVVLRLT